MLTKLPIALIEGNGKANMFVMNRGDSLDVSAVPASTDVKIGDIQYDPANGVLILLIVKGTQDLSVALTDTDIIDYVTVRGFVRARDLRYGAQGKFGRNGANGVNGLNGFDGMEGERGPRGFNGLRGIAGKPGPKGRRGIQGIQGYQGENGVVGPAGNDGANGKQGEVGKKGKDGADLPLPIVVSNSNPGAIGAGAFWVKPSNFVYGVDEVEFTVVGSKEDVTCSDTIAVYQQLTQGAIPPSWVYREMHNVNTATYALRYEHACLDQNGSLILIAQCYSIRGDTTVIIKDGNLLDTELHLIQPKCFCNNDALYLVTNKQAITIKNDAIESTIIFNNISIEVVYDYFVHDSTFYLCCDKGLLITKTGNDMQLKYKQIFTLIFYHGDRFFANTEGFVYSDSVYFGEEKQYNGNAVQSEGNIYLTYYKDGFASVHNLDGNLLYSIAADALIGNIIVRGTSHNAIFGYGIKYLDDPDAHSVNLYPYYIEYDKQYIFVEDKS